MDNSRINNNDVTMVVKVIKKPEYSHEVYGENFYICNVSVSRLSNENDEINLMISDRLIDIDSINVGNNYLIEQSSIRSHNIHNESGKTKLILNVFVRSITYLSDEDAEGYKSTNNNMVNLVGFICKPTIYRTTPLGRDICDILLAVNRSYGKSDYIPCIAWGRNAKFASNLNVGDKIEIQGRFQSRTYNKNIYDENDNSIIATETRTAYEVSIAKISVIENNEKEN